MIEQWSRNRDTPTVAREDLIWHPVGASSPLRIDLAAFFARVVARLRRPS
jgi:hypothetical protein